MTSPPGHMRWRWRLAFFVTLAWAQCYLEDATATCAACWLTDSDGDQMLGRCKSSGVVVEWLEPVPERLLHGVEYNVEYRLKINMSVYSLLPVDVENAASRVQLPHTNLHSCVQTGMACTPFVKDSPGLSTHTPALSGNLTVMQDREIMSETFRTSVSLEEGRYTIIAHSRFFIPGAGGQVQVDAAVGVKRIVLPNEQAGTDPSAWVGAAGFGAVMLILSVSLVWAAKRGSLDVDSILAAITCDEVVVVADCVFGLADVAAYSVGLWTEICVHPALKDIVPLSFLFLVTGWAAFLLSLVCNVKQLILIVQRHHCEAVYLERAVSKVRSSGREGTPSNDPAESKNRDSVLSAQVAGKRLIVEYEQASAKVRKMYTGVITLIFTDIPLAGIGGYTLANGDQGLMALVVAMISSMFVGLKLNGLTNFRHNKQDLLKSANNLLDYLDDSGAHLQEFQSTHSHGSCPGSMNMANLMHITGRQLRPPCSETSECSWNSDVQFPPFFLDSRAQLVVPGKSTPALEHLEHAAKTEREEGPEVPRERRLPPGPLSL